MEKVKIKEISTINTKLQSGPIILTFEHAQVIPDLGRDSNPVKATLYENELEDVQSVNRRLSRNANTKKRRLLVVETDRLTYLASSEHSLNNVKEVPQRTFIGIRKKKKMRLYETTSMVLSPFIDGLTHVQENERDTTIAETKEDKKKTAIALVKDFGSKKKVQTYEQNEKTQLNKEMMQDKLDAAADQAEVSEINVKDESILTLIPPCDRKACDIKLVYNINDILLKAELDEMEELATEFLNCSKEQVKSWQDSKQFSEYMFAMFKILSTRKSDPRSIYKAKMVLYAELLICLIKMPYNNIRKKVIPFPSQFPSWMTEKALDLFTTLSANSSRTRSEKDRDKAICYVFVLVLFANDYSFDVNLMTTSLQIHIKKLLTLAKAVGITIKYNASLKIYSGGLKLPLPAQIEKRGMHMKKNR